MKVRLKSKLGRSFWKFKTLLSPDDWSEFDLDEEQLKSIRSACELKVSEGGSLAIEPNPWAKKAEKKDDGKKVEP